MHKSSRPMLLLACVALCSTAAWAKLPPPSEEAKAKAAEAAAKAAWSGKVANYQLCVSQDRVAAAYRAKKAATDLKPPVETPPCADPGPFVAAPPAGAPSAPAPAPATAATAPAAAPPASAPKS